MTNTENLHPSFGEQDLSDDLFSEYLTRVGEGEEIDIKEFLQSRGFSDVAVDVFKKELSGYETYRKLLQARTLAGKKVGPYQLVRELGKGGMGRVFLAEDSRKNNRQVALKLLHGFEPGTIHVRERFRREYEMVASLHHPNIVPMLDAGESDGFRYYAMEYINGFTLDQVVSRLKARDISRIRAEDVGKAVNGKGDLWRGTYIDWVCWILSSVGEALSHAHRRGIIHRDIKPSNMLLSPAGRPYLFDFGLAVDDRATRITRTGEILGTPVYMAPEQIQGGKKPIDERTDVYSFGVTLYELLTLRLPFEGENAHEVAHRILFDDPVRPRRHNPSIPAALEAIVMTAIAKDPARRYPTIGALVKDLRNYFCYRPIQARVIRPGEMIRNYTKKRPLAAAAIFASLMIVPSMVAMWSISKGSAQVERHNEVVSLVHRGVEAFTLKEWPVAEGFFNRILKLDPENSRALALRGLTRARGFQDNSGALEDLNQAMKLDDSSRGIRALKAALVGQPSPLRYPDPRFPLQKTPGEGWDFFLEGLYFFSMKNDMDRALTAFSEAITRDRAEPLFHLLRGVAYQQSYQYPDSLLDLNAFTVIEPSNPIGYFYLSRTLRHTRTNQEAGRALDKAYKLMHADMNWDYLDQVSHRFMNPGAGPGNADNLTEKGQPTRLMK